MEKYELVNKIKNAILNGERIIIIGDGVFELPERQKSGTYFQQHTYAMLEANKIVYGN
jgi:nucleoid DNA-binding protein